MFNINAYDSINQTKGLSLVTPRLAKTNLAKSKVSPTIKVETISHDVGRMHHKITLTTKYEFMLGDILKYVGLDKVEEIKSTVYVESVDVSNYINTVKLTNYGLQKLSKDTKILGMINSVIGMMKSVFGLFK